MTNDLPVDLITAVQDGLLGAPKEELRHWFVQLGETTEEADRFFSWLHQRSRRSHTYFRTRNGAHQPTAYKAPHRNEISLAVRLQKEADQRSGGGLVLDEQLISVDGTRKLLFTTEDGHRVESVLIPMGDHYTQCVSSQVGCRLGCTFCLTAKMGLTRHLKSAEIVNQVHWGSTIPLQDVPIQNIVFMGMGEPLDNLSEVIRACKVLLDTDGFNFSSRKVTVSTAGVVPRIADLIQAVPVQLAVSLNAVTDEKRNQIMPINRRWPLAELKQGLMDLNLNGRRRIALEYVLLRDFNDQPEDAAGLVEFVSDMGRIKINLIPWNSFDDPHWQRPDDNVILRFRDTLLANNVSATIRENKGTDIGASCGQLDGVLKEIVTMRNPRTHDPAIPPRIQTSQGNHDDFALVGYIHPENPRRAIP